MHPVAERRVRYNVFIDLPDRPTLENISMHLRNGKKNNDMCSVRKYQCMLHGAGI